MTDDEWKILCKFVDDCWSGEFPKSKANSYRVFLDKFTPGVLLAGLQRISETGKPYLPAVPEIVQACRKVEEEESGDGPVPSWAEAFQALQRGIWVRVGYFAKNEEKTATVVAWLQEHSHPVVAAFFETLGGYAGYQALELEDPDYGGARRHQLEERWHEFVDVARERLASGRALAAVGRRELGPARLDAAALLERWRLEQPVKELEAGKEG